MTLDQRLADAARHVASQVAPPDVDLVAIRSRARASRRRTTAIALAAAVVTAVLVTLPLLGARDRAAPLPATTPTSGVIRTLGDTTCTTQARCLEPGTYTVDLRQDVAEEPLKTMVTVRDGGWESKAYQHRLSRRAGAGTVALHAYQPSRLAGPQPCDEADPTRVVEPDATVDDVAHLLATLEQLAVVDGPRALRAFGRDARYLRVRADRIACPVADARYHLVDIKGGDLLDIDPGQPVEIQFWVVDLDGRTVVVEARREGRPDAAAVQELDQLRDSLTFVLAD